MKRIGMALGCAALLGFSGWSESVAKTPAKWDMEARSRAIRSAPRCPNGEGEETKNVCIRGETGHPEDFELHYPRMHEEKLQ